MSDTVWDGVTKAGSLKPEQVERRRRLADTAKAYDWGTLLALLEQDSQLINSTRPGGGQLAPGGGRLGSAASDQPAWQPAACRRFRVSGE
jgi:hypothetical protein